MATGITSTELSKDFINGAVNRMIKSRIEEINQKLADILVQHEVFLKRNMA